MNKLFAMIDAQADHNRVGKYELFMEWFKPDQSTRVLDVGASELEYRGAANILEKKYPFPQKITVLGVDEFVAFKTRYPLVKVVTYSGQLFPFKDNEFDLCWSNAVLEHVGDFAAQARCLREIKRVSRHAFITTPNRYFPIELHTKIPLLHYLPKSLFDKFLVLVRKKWAANAYMHLLSLKDIKRLLEASGITEYTIVKKRYVGMVLEFIIRF